MTLILSYHYCKHLLWHTRIYTSLFRCLLHYLDGSRQHCQKQIYSIFLFLNCIKYYPYFTVSNFTGHNFSQAYYTITFHLNSFPYLNSPVHVINNNTFHSTTANKALNNTHIPSRLFLLSCSYLVLARPFALTFKLITILLGFIYIMQKKIPHFLNKWNQRKTTC